MACPKRLAFITLMTIWLAVWTSHTSRSGRGACWVMSFSWVGEQVPQRRVMNRLSHRAVVPVAEGPLRRTGEGLLDLRFRRSGGRANRGVYQTAALFRMVNYAPKVAPGPVVP